MNASSLAGKRILITRTQEQCAPVAEMVHKKGGIPVVAPCIALRWQPQALAEAIADLPPGNDLLITSANGVRALQKAGISKEKLRTLRIIAIGKKTAFALQACGLAPAIVPDEHHQEGLWRAWQKAGLAPQVLFVRAEQGRDWIIERLQASGVQVRLVPAYRIECAEDQRDRLQEALLQGVNGALFGSRTTSECFVRLVGEALACKALAHAVVVAISKRAAEPLGRLGLKVELPDEPVSFEAMLQLLERRFAGG